MSKWTQFKPGTRELGVTLVELLVAMAIGVAIIAGLAYIYVQGRQGYRVQDGVSRIQEDLRFVTEFVSKDMRNGAYMGCRPPQRLASGLRGDSASLRFTGAHPWFTETGSDSWLMWNLAGGIPKMSFAVRGFEGGAGWPNTATLADRYKPGTDVVMFMRIGDESRRAVGVAKGVSEFTIDGDPLPGYTTNSRLAVLAVSSCAAGAEIVKATIQNGGRRFSIANTYNESPDPDVANQTVSTLQLEHSEGDAIVSVFQPVVYYISRAERNPSTNLPTLVRASIADRLPAASERTGTGVWDSNGGQVIASGVENMQLRYQVDGQYRTAAEVNALGDAEEFWPRVTAVEVTLTFVSQDAKLRGAADAQVLIDGSSVTDGFIRRETRFVVDLANRR